MSQDKENFKDWLVVAIKQKGIRKADLARAIGVSRATVTQWCNGQIKEVSQLNKGQIDEFFDFNSGRKELVSIDGDYVIFKADNSWDYDIPLRDLRSGYSVAEWTLHMAEKSWVTKEHLRQFAQIVKEIRG